VKWQVEKRAKSTLTHHSGISGVVVPSQSDEWDQMTLVGKKTEVSDSI